MALRRSVANAVQRCTGMVLKVSVEQEMVRVMEAGAAWAAWRCSHGRTRPDGSFSQLVA